MRVLIIEDDKELCSILEYQLNKNGFSSDFCYDGADASFYTLKQSYDVIVLDRMLPNKDGISILKELRTENISTPVILVTAMNSLTNRIEGLDCGADDYLTKPFDIEELLARLRALSRRNPGIKASNTINVGDITLDTDELTLHANGLTTTVSKRELDLFVFFIHNKERILPREMLLDRVWGSDSFVSDGNLDNYIFFLRKRLNAVKSTVQIKTVRSVGYRLEA